MCRIIDVRKNRFLSSMFAYLLSSSQEAVVGREGAQSLAATAARCGGDPLSREEEEEEDRRNLNHCNTTELRRPHRPPHLLSLTTIKCHCGLSSC